MKRFTLYFLVMVLLGLPAGALGQGQETLPERDGTLLAQAEDGPDMDSDSDMDMDMGWDAAPEPPGIHMLLEPRFDTSLGFAFVDLDGSTRALEYAWPHSSVTAGLELSYHPLPHRLHLDIDWINKHDYHAVVSYAYRDILRFDYLGWSLYHNLDHFKPLPLAGLNDRNPGEAYHVTARSNRIFLRLKWPDRPYHAFAEYRQFEREGTVQARFDSPPKTARSRDIEWITRRYMAGVNGNLGMVELEYNHKIKTFDPHKDVALVDTVGIIFAPPGATTSPHSVMPELTTNSDTIKVHTDMTGRVVAAATLVSGEKKNNTSGAEVDFRRAYANLVLIPFENVTVALRYRYKELQVDAPETVNDVTRHGVVATNDPMDRRTNRAELAVRYSPTTRLGMNAEYIFENIERYNAKAWSDPGGADMVFPFQDIPYSQNRHTVKLGVNVRPVSDLRVKGTVNYAYTQDPAYPVEPMNSFRGKVDASWTPYYTVTANAYYNFRRDENNTANMEAERDNVGGLVSWMPLDRLSCYANYDYSRYSNKRDIQLVAGDPSAGPTVLFPLESVPYADISHLYAVGVAYMFEFPLSLNAEFRQSWSRGKYRTSGFEPVNAVTSDGIGELTDLSIRETGGSISAGYDFPGGWGTSLTYSINDYQDLVDKPQDGFQDGTAQSVFVMVSKKWK